MTFDPLIKIEAIKYITPPTHWKIFCNFIGLLNYYCDIWSIISHALEPITNLTSNKLNLKYKNVEQKVFKDINRIVFRNTLLDYPGLNRLF